MPILSKIIGDPNARVVKRLSPTVAEINKLEDEVKKLADDQLKARTQELRDRLGVGDESAKNAAQTTLTKKTTLDDLLPEAFALAREAARRTVGMRHFDVQLIGGMVLHRGQIAQMATGEGKTLVATAPVYLNALPAKGVHVVTVNDYLARRDAGWMGQVYHALGLTTAVIMHEASFILDPEYTDPDHSDERLVHLRPIERQEAYAADITYGTNNEFGFDYLRDNMVQDLSQVRQRPFTYAIVDEVDSILIDEARTPLIISQPGAKSTDRYYNFARIAKNLKAEEDYTVDEKQKAVSLTEGGISKIEKDLGVDNIYEAGRLEDVHHVEAALKAEAVFRRDRDYIVSPEGEIIIVDEFTGRLLPGRRYSEGLHQAIEAKEGVSIQQESQTLATISFQNLFRLYPKLAGMTGTATTEAEEFAKIYELEVVAIPTNQPMVRDDLKDRVYKNEAGKFKSVVTDVKARHDRGQPVLIGTVSIEKNEILSRLLHEAKIPHEMLNAKNNEREAEIIARAGERGAITLATNIAGRGTDIVLGDGVADLGGLHVLGTERHESRRIDNQLRGRAGRQGDAGSSQFYVSLEDDLMRIFGSDRIGGLMGSLGIDDTTPIENRIVSRALESAQKKVEGHNFDIRKHLVEYDDVMNKHREIIYGRRRDYLAGKELRQQIMSSLDAQIEHFVREATSTVNNQADLAKLTETFRTIMPALPDDWHAKLHSQTHDVVVNTLHDLIEQQYNQRAEQFGDEAMHLVERLVCLRVIDSLWLEHLEAMDYLRDGISLRGYGQRDPLVEYKSEAYKMFQSLLGRIDADIAQMIFKVEVTNTPANAPVETELTRAAARISSPREAGDVSVSSGSGGEGGNRAARRAAARAARKNS